MSQDELLGLVIGIGALAAILGYVTDVYVHPRRFRWLEFQRLNRGPAPGANRTLEQRPGIDDPAR